MKLFYDLLPIVVFFTAYKLYNIYIATAAAIIGSLILIVTTIARGKRPDMMQLVTITMIVILGGATLFFRNELFIKWKPTVVYWLLCGIFLSSQIFSEKTLVQKMLDKSITLTPKAWAKLNISWFSFFFVMGVLNLVIVYSFNTDTWVNFKLFGTLALTILFVIMQGILVSRYLPEANHQKKSHFKGTERDAARP